MSSDHHRVIPRGHLLCWLLLSPGLVLAQSLDDPMRPSTRERPEMPSRPAEPSEPAKPKTFRPSDYPVSRIYVLGDTRRVLIQGEWYEPGDRLADAVITDILPDAAVVMHGDLMHMLYRSAGGASFRRNEESQ